MNTYLNAEWIGNFLFSVIRVSTPLIYGALAAVMTKKAGLLNLALESMMLTAALVGVLVSGATQSVTIGFLMAILAGMAVAATISYFAFGIKADLYLTSISVNLAAVGGTVFVLYLTCGQKATSAASIASLALPNVNIPIIRDIPFIGRVLSGHNVLTYASIAAVALVYFIIYRTRMGLRIRSVGENPQAAQSVGISTVKIQLIAFLMSGMFAGISGAYMSMGYVTWFSRDMIAGRGFISMSAMNIANGSPIGSALAAFIFGFADAAANALQMSQIPAEFVMMFPYAATILGLVMISVIRIVKHRKLISRKLA